LPSKGLFVQYFAKLVFGRYYKTVDNTFEIGEEVSISKEEHDYLATVKETKLTAEGNGYRVVDVPRFALRQEEDTPEQMADKVIANAPDKISIKRPTR
jgi:hypothetical protein